MCVSACVCARASPGVVGWGVSSLTVGPVFSARLTKRFQAELLSTLSEDNHYLITFHHLGDGVPFSHALRTAVQFNVVRYTIISIFTVKICKSHMRHLSPAQVGQSRLHLSFSCQYSLCNESLIELTNPGASGSIFYVTRDDEFIIKTVQHKEAEFLQKLLPGYYMVSKTGYFNHRLSLVAGFFQLYSISDVKAHAKTSLLANPL